jgi:two-component system NarL family sensor kinase
MLAAMKINLDSIGAEIQGKNTTVDKLVAETTAFIVEISRQLRTMSYLLHPPLLDETGLQSALRWYAEGFAQRSGIQVDLKINPEFRRLPDDLEIAIFRVVQESLTNIHRHSGSPTATIELTSSPENIQLQIVDDGKGMPDRASRDSKFVPGVGIMGMQERMRQFGGTFEILSKGKGTTVVATVPTERTLREAV